MKVSFRTEIIRFLRDNLKAIVRMNLRLHLSEMTEMQRELKLILVVVVLTSRCFKSLHFFLEISGGVVWRPLIYCIVGASHMLGKW